MRQPQPQTPAPLDPDPKWPDGYIEALRRAGSHEKNIPYCVSWVNRFFQRFPGRPRRELGRSEIEEFLSETARRPGVSNWQVQQARNAVETYHFPLLVPECIPSQHLPSSLFKVLFAGAGLCMRRTPPPIAEMATGQPWRRPDSTGACWRSVFAKACGSSTTPIPPHRSRAARPCQR